MDGFHQAANILQKPLSNTYGRYSEEDFSYNKVLEGNSDGDDYDEEEGYIRNYSDDNYSVYSSKKQKIVGVDNPLHSGKNSPHTNEVNETIKLNNIKISGYLFKLSTKGQWLKRFFFVKNGALYYSQTEFNLNPIETSSSISAVLVANLIISTVKESERDLQFDIISPGSRGSGNGGGTYCLKAENFKNYKKWVLVIRTEIATHLSNNTTPSAKTSSMLNLPASVVHSMNGFASSDYFFNPSKKNLTQIYANNKYCCDCGSSNSKHEWTSINFFSNLCIECSGVHRSMGTHISKIRSLSLDKWNQNLLDLILYFTNDKVNRIMEEKFDSTSKFTDDFNVIEFINNKYNNKLYLKSDSNLSADYWDKKVFSSIIQGDLSSLFESIVHGGKLDEPYQNETKTAEIKDIQINYTLQTSTSSSSSFNGMTPLMIASLNGDYLSVELLLQWGAIIDIKHQVTNKTACDYAKDNNYSRVVMIFENRN